MAYTGWMTIAIAGGSGFLGRKLATRLTSGGHRVLTLTRRPNGGPNSVTWHPDGSAGTLIAPSRWTPTSSSTSPARTSPAGAGRPHKRSACGAAAFCRPVPLVRAIAQCRSPRRAFVSASGVGYYGPHGDEPVTEDTPPGSDFFGRLCVDWEEEARAVPPATRLVIVRSSPVLGADGGALKKMLLPFKLGLGATLGSGEQFFPWIHADDWTAMVTWMIENDRATGAFNAASPTPVTNREFTHTLARVLKRPAMFHAPAFALRAALGELADVLLTGQRALPAHAERLGFRFTYRTLEPALRSLHL